MATISNTPRPGYVWDATDNCWYPIGTGPHSHADYITAGSAINPNIVDAKGDLIAGVAADSVNRLAVGSNDQVLVADSTTSTGLAWKSVATPFAAGKNKIINGDFGIWQRGTSFTNPASLSYTADRWSHYYDGSVTSVISRQTFTPGTAPVAGYEGSFFWRWAISAYSGGTVGTFFQKIEDVRTFAGQTVTVSFWAKADAARTLTVGANQNYGSGGSGANGVGSFSASLTTSWQRFTGQLNIPSIAGKTIGTGSSLEISFQIAQNTVQTIDVWGVQVETGSVATAFQTATGTLQGELAACQRYFYQLTGSNGSGGTSEPLGLGTYYNASIFRIPMRFPVAMRTAPAVTASNVANYFSLIGNGVSLGYPTVTLDIATTNSVILNIATTGGTTGQAAWVQTANAASFVSFSAEL